MKKNLLNRINNSEELWTLSHLAALTYVISLVFFTILFLITPIIIQMENFIPLGIAAVTYKIVSLFYMCHQLPERSFLLLGVQFPVCARCVGIYIGSSIGGLIALFYKKPKWLSSKMLLALFIISTLPLVIDGVTQTLLYQRESSNMMRLITGLAFGFGILYTVCSVVFEKARKLSKELKEVNKLALSVNILLILAILIAGLWMGTKYVSKEKALNTALEQVGANPESVMVYYLPPNALRNIRNDPYLGSYNDIIVADAAGIKFEGHEYGVWAVALLNEPILNDGKTVFQSRTKGSLVFIDAWTGKIVKSLEYS